jgi:hypothetical protein
METSANTEGMVGCSVLDAVRSHLAAFQNDQLHVREPQSRNQSGMNFILGSASRVMMTSVLEVDLWPRALEKKEVEQHKDLLRQKAVAAQTSGSHLAARSLARGALYWERWLFEREPGSEERAITSLELARDAGDWKEAELLLAHCESSPNLGQHAFIETWRDIVRDHLPRQVEHEQRLEIAFQRFRNAQSEENEDAKLELVRELSTRAKEIGEVGSPVAVNNFLARISASVGWNEEAETYYTALVVCRPLWIPYIVQLSEHQAKADIKRAFRTLETARSLLGKDFWLVT